MSKNVIWWEIMGILRKYSVVEEGYGIVLQEDEFVTVVKEIKELENKT